MLMFSELSPSAAAALFAQQNTAALPELTDDHTVLTVQDGGELIGFALLLREHDRVWLTDLYICETNRRCGFGRTLLSVAASKAVQWEQWLLYAHAPKDPVAAAFCSAVGFRPLESEPTLLVLDLTDTGGMRHGH